MLPFILRRALGVAITVFLIATLVFVLLRVTSDPVATLVTGEATAEQIEQVRIRLGLDRPLTVQYGEYLLGIVTGTMGPSYRYEIPAMELVLQRVPATLLLSVAAFALAVLVAVPLGMLAAMRRGTIVDHLASGLAFLGFAVPAFWLGSVLIIVFGVQLRWLPTSGAESIRHLILPTITLAMWPLGQLTRLVRSELLSVISDDYIRTARAKGLSTWTIIVKHGMRNAMLPVITLMGLLFGTMLGGAVVTETIFAWPGLGRLTLEAALNRDFPVIEAGVVFLATAFNLLNLATDMTYAFIDPRIQTA
jgi:peptide/nickel transport system permease protein